MTTQHTPANHVPYLPDLAPDAEIPDLNESTDDPSGVGIDYRLFNPNHQRIEIAVYRDPDLHETPGTRVIAAVNGEPVGFEQTIVDPAPGRTRQQWNARRADAVRHASPLMAAAIHNFFDAGAQTRYVTDGTPPERIEAVIYRDPDGCGAEGMRLALFINGMPVEVGEPKIIDPGAGYERHDWDESCEFAVAAASPLAAQVIREWYADGAETEFITEPADVAGES